MALGRLRQHLLTSRPSLDPIFLLNVPLARFFFCFQPRPVVSVLMSWTLLPSSASQAPYCPQAPHF